MTFEEYWNYQDTSFQQRNFRDDMHDAWIAATNAEREACAAECERLVMFPGGEQESFAHHGVQAAAEAVRNRSKG